MLSKKYSAVNDLYMDAREVLKKMQNTAVLSSAALSASVNINIKVSQRFIMI